MALGSYIGSNTLWLVFGNVGSLGCPDAGSFMPESSTRSPFKQLSPDGTALDLSALRRSCANEAALDQAYTGIDEMTRYASFSASPDRHQRVDLSSISSSSPYQLPTTLVDTSAVEVPSRSRNDHKADEEFKKPKRSCSNSPKRKRKLKKIAKQTPMAGKKRDTFRRCTQNLGVFLP